MPDGVVAIVEAMAITQDQALMENALMFDWRTGHQQG